MSWNFDENISIFQQITEHISLEIVSGKYKAGDKLPTVRDLAVQAGVNPNTMQRALAKLEDDGLASSNRTQGRIVTANQARIDELKSKFANRYANELIAKLRQLGLSNEEIIKTVSEELQ